MSGLAVQSKFVVLAICAVVFLTVFVFEPDPDDFAKTIIVNGVLTFESNGKSSSSELNGQDLYASAGAFGGGEMLSPHRTGIDGRAVVSVRVAEIRSLMGNVRVAMSIEALNKVYFVQTPSICISRWRRETFAQTIELIMVATIAWMLISIAFMERRSGRDSSAGDRSNA